MRDLSDDGDGDDGEQARRQGPVQPGQRGGQRDRQREQPEHRPLRVLGEPAEGDSGGAGRVLHIRLRHAQRAGNLLGGDDNGDPDREALNQRPRDVSQEPADPQHGGGDHDDAGEQRDRVDHRRPELRYERDKHHGHRAGRPGHLQVRAAEDRRDRPGDHGGDQPGRSPDSGGHAEGQRERQRHDPDRDAGRQVAPPGPPQSAVVPPAWQQGADRSDQRARGTTGCPAAVGLGGGGASVARSGDFAHGDARSAPASATASLASSSAASSTCP
jgi:hypothetical protein